MAGFHYYSNLPNQVGPLPGLNGLQAWTADLMAAAVTSGTMNSTLYFQAISLIQGQTFTNAYALVGTGQTGSTLQVGLYSSTKLLASSTAVASATSAAQVVMPLSYTVPATGIYWVVLAASATGSYPGVVYANGASSLNAYEQNVGPNNTPVANTLTQRISTLGTGPTLPTTISGTPTSGGRQWWIGLA